MDSLGQGTLGPRQSLALSITVSAGTLAEARRWIHGCGTCCNNAQISFGQLLARLVGRFDREYEYVLEEDISCPACLGPIDADTRVELHLSMKVAAAKISLNPSSTENAWRPCAIFAHRY